MPDVDRLAAAGLVDAPDVLPGHLVRDLVNRNEEEIEALVARLTEVEAAAEAVEQEVRVHPGLALLDPDVVADLVPEPTVPEIDPDRPRTTVVRRASPGTSSDQRGGRPATPTPTTTPTTTSMSTAPVATPTEAPPGLVGRLTTSHWWWRIGIVLVLVALVLLKFG